MSTGYFGFWLFLPRDDLSRPVKELCLDESDNRVDRVWAE